MFIFFNKRRNNGRPSDPRSRPLSIETIEAVTRPGAVSMTEADDRREFTRVCIGTRAKIRTGRPDSMPFPALVRDISIKSVGLLLDQPIATGDRCWVYLPKRSDPCDHVAVSCIIERCVRAGLEGSVYLAAATFVEGEAPALPKTLDTNKQPAPPLKLSQKRLKSSIFLPAADAAAPANPK